MKSISTNLCTAIEGSEKEGGLKNSSMLECLKQKRREKCFSLLGGLGYAPPRKF